MKMIYRSTFTAAAALSMAGFAQGALLTQNPSFESVTNGDNNNNPGGTNGNTIDGWDVTFATGTFAGWNPFAQSQDIPSNIDGSVALRLNNTTITTTPTARPAVTAGTEYALDALAGELVLTSSDQQTLALEFFDASGVLLSSFDFAFTPVDRGEDDPLAAISVSGVAPTGSVTAGARYVAVGDWAMVDNFELTVVPEPASAALAMTGLGTMLLRRRN